MSELIYGRRAVLETLKADRRHLFRLWLEGDHPPKEGSSLAQFVALAEERNVPTRSIKGGLFDKLIREGVRTQGVTLEAGDYPYISLDDCLDRADAAGEPPLSAHARSPAQDPAEPGHADAHRRSDGRSRPPGYSAWRAARHHGGGKQCQRPGAVEHMGVVQINNLNRTMRLR